MRQWLRDADRSIRESSEYLAADPAQHTVGVIGQPTAETAAEHGIDGDVIPTEATFEALAATVDREERERRVRCRLQSVPTSAGTNLFDRSIIRRRMRQIQSDRSFGERGAGKDTSTEPPS